VTHLTLAIATPLFLMFSCTPLLYRFLCSASQALSLHRLGTCTMEKGHDIYLFVPSSPCYIPPTNILPAPLRFCCNNVDLFFLYSVGFGSLEGFAFIVLIPLVPLLPVVPDSPANFCTCTIFDESQRPPLIQPHSPPEHYFPLRFSLFCFGRQSVLSLLFFRCPRLVAASPKPQRRPAV